jgi:hypothetical protein
MAIAHPAPLWAPSGTPRRAGLGWFSALPDGLLSGELLRRVSQRDLASVSLASHALRAAARPLLSRALRCSFCRSHLLHPRDLARTPGLDPPLYIVGASLPPTVVSRNARVYCAECLANIGKIVAVDADAPPVVAFEKGPVRLVNSENQIVGLDGVAAPVLAMPCVVCGETLGDAAEDLMYGTKRNGVSYLCCYALDGAVAVGDKQYIVDEIWGRVRTEDIACASCGVSIGFRYRGRHPSAATRRSEASSSVDPHRPLHDSDYDEAVLDDIGNVFYVFLQFEKVRHTPNLAYSLPLRPP